MSGAFPNEANPKDGFCAQICAQNNIAIEGRGIGDVTVLIYSPEGKSDAQAILNEEKQEEDSDDDD